MIKLNMVLVFVLFLSAIPSIFAGGCDKADSDKQGSTPPPEITVEEAKTVLDQAVVYASEHQLDKLCAMGGAISICEHHWRDAGEWEGAPSEAPTIVDTYVIAERKTESGNSVGGRILVLEGVDGKGEPYRTEFFVFRDEGSGCPAALYPIYWSGIGIAEYDEEGRAITGTAPQTP